MIPVYGSDNKEIRMKQLSTRVNLSRHYRYPKGIQHRAKRIRIHVSLMHLNIIEVQFLRVLHNIFLGSFVISWLSMIFVGSNPTTVRLGEAKNQYTVISYFFLSFIKCFSKTALNFEKETVLPLEFKRKGWHFRPLSDRSHHTKTKTKLD